MERVTKLSVQKAVVIFTANNECPMSYTVMTLFSGLGVSAAVHELDKDPRGRDMERDLARRLGRNPPVPAVFIGGKLVGSTDKIMSLHLGGKLVPMLKAAGAMWLSDLPHRVRGTSAKFCPTRHLLIPVLANFCTSRACMCLHA